MNGATKNKMIMIVAFLLFLFVAALGFMWYPKTQNTNTNDGPLQVVFNGDGTFSQRSVSGTEYFAYTTNADSGGVSGKTKDDPIEFQYYTDKTTRGSIWKGLMNTIPENSPECTAPGCVRVSVTDKEGMQTMINEVYSDLKVGVKEFRAFLVQKGLHTTAAFVAKYKEYNPHGYYAVKYPESYSQQINSMHYRFMFDVLIKGFAEFKNVTVPSDMTSETYIDIHDYSDFYDQLYPRTIFNFVMDVMYGHVTLSDTSSSIRKIQITNGEKTVELRLGVDYPISIGIMIIALVLIIKEDKTIDSVVYNPPNNPLSMKHLTNSMRTKMSSLERMTENLTQSRNRTEN